MIRNVNEIHEFPLVARADSRSQALISLRLSSRHGRVAFKRGCPNVRHGQVAFKRGCSHVMAGWPLRGVVLTSWLGGL